MALRLPPIGERFERLEETLRLARQMWSGDASPGVCRSQPAAAGASPETLTTAGLASATAAMLSPLALLEEPLVLLIPAGRMTGLIVIGVAGERLSREPASPAEARGAP